MKKLVLGTFIVGSLSLLLLACEPVDAERREPLDQSTEQQD